MTPKELGMAIAAGFTSGIVTLSAVSGGGFGMLLAYVTPLPLVLIGFAFGGRLCLAACAVGALVTGAAGLAALPAFLAIGALPALLLTVLTLLKLKTVDGFQRWLTPGEMLVGLALVAAVVMILTSLALPTDGKPIEDWLRAQVAPVIETGLPGVPDDMKATIIGLWIAVMPAIIGGAWLAMTVINGLFGQWAASKAGHAMRPTPEYLSLRLPIGLALAAGLAGSGGLIGGDVGYLARNMAIVLAGPFLLAGLAEVHGTLRTRSPAGLWLALFYGAFLALFGWAAIAVTVWGLVTQWMRSRRPEPAHDQEDK